MKLFLISISLCVHMFAQPWSVVCSKSLKIQNAESLKFFYLKKLRYIEHKKVIPLNLSYVHKARQQFMSDVLGIKKSSWQRYWDKMHFKGMDTPVVVESVESMKRYLHKLPTSIGYIPRNEVDKSLVEITHFEVN